MTEEIGKQREFDNTFAANLSTYYQSLNAAATS